MKTLPMTGKNPGLHADISAHRILSDLQTFIDHLDPSRYRILAAGDLNMFLRCNRLQADMALP